MSMYGFLLRDPLFQMSHDDAEIAHLWTIKRLKQLQDHPRLLNLVARWFRADENPEPITVAGITFPNRVGLAAGFDKNAEVAVAMQALGFGSIEIGSVLPKPQEGNPRPRMFRFPKHEAIVNRMGFNSQGMGAVVQNIKKYRPMIRVPLGISLGKHKDTPNEQAEKDYLVVFNKLYPFASYAAVNISSPNTTGLRDLQAKAGIERVVGSVVWRAKEVAREHNRNPVPIFVKLAPDLTNGQLEDTIEACEQAGSSGYILANTSIDPKLKEKLGTTEMGGISGPLVFPRALEMVSLVREKLPNTVIIGVGGINSGLCAQQMIDRGASLVQILAGLVYRGPRLIQEIRALR